MELIKEKIEFCKNGIVRAYNESNKMSNFVIKSLEAKTDGQFVQIGLKQITDPVWFVDHSYTPTFGDLGMAVSDGELRYLIETISKSDKIKKHLIDSINPSKMVNILNELSTNESFHEDTILLVSHHTESSNFLDDKNHFGFDNKMNLFVADTGRYKIPMYGIRSDIIGNKIIILNKNFGLWKYIQFKNSENRIDNIHVEIGFDRSNFYILVRSLIKLEIINPTLVYVIEMTELEKSQLEDLNLRVSQAVKEKENFKQIYEKALEEVKKVKNNANRT